MADHRHMKYPYTLSAKIVQFPFKFHFKNSWLWRYYAYALVVCTPVFLAIDRAANSTANKNKWAETQRKQAESEHH